MGTTDGGGSAVRYALASGSTSVATVAQLKRLLDIQDAPPAKSASRVRGDATAAKRAGFASKSAPNGTAPAANRKPSPPKPTGQMVSGNANVKVKPPLSAREQYALATETINTSLKFLTEKLRAVSPSGHDGQHSPEPPAQIKRPLQPRSQNATPAKPPSKKTLDIDKTPKHDVPLAANFDARPTARCAVLALAHLRGVDCESIGVRPPPMLQLEKGSLALVSALIGHKLYDLAAIELRAVKARLDGATQPSLAARKQAGLADLLKIETTNGKSVEDDTLPVAITYYQSALKLIAASATPAEILRIPETLFVGDPNGVVDTIVRHGQASKAVAKAAKQLLAVAHTLLSLCPSVASSADDIAADQQRYAYPETVFKIQILALRIRVYARALASRTTDVDSEIVEPLYKCMSAFARRHGYDAATASELLERAYSQLPEIGTAGGRSRVYDIHDVLCSKAEQADMCERALQWTDEMRLYCHTLEEGHAKRLALCARRLSLQHRCRTPLEDTELQQLSTLLRGSITGSSAEYGLLVNALADLCRGRPAMSTHAEVLPNLAKNAAGFVERYIRSYPGRQIQQCETVIEAALRSSKSSEDMLSWITSDAANLYVNAGTLAEIAAIASKRPLQEACSTSPAAVAMSRILRALILRALRSPGDTSVYDVCNLDVAARGVILEWQLYYLLELAPRAKYQPAMEKIVPDVLGRLSTLYTTADFPIRRARVASMVFALRECHSACVPPHVLSVWNQELGSNITNLVDDTGLIAYLEDTSTRIRVARLLSDGSPSIDDVLSCTDRWQRLLKTCKDSTDVRNRIEDTAMFMRQLRALMIYLELRGYDKEALTAAKLLLNVHSFLDDQPKTLISAAVDVARLYLRLGHVEKAQDALRKSSKQLAGGGGPSVEALQHAVARAECLAAKDDPNGCNEALNEARQLRSKLAPADVPRTQRRAYELVHAQAWLVHSNCCLEIGRPHDALSAAKQSVRLLNSIWASLERSEGDLPSKVAEDASGSGEAALNGLTNGVSKLNLRTEAENGTKGGREQSKKGATFWPVVPVLCKALLQLSSKYTHHGVFAEANYYSERAMRIAESVASKVWLHRVRSHRCQLLCLAGGLEDAELCLNQDCASAEDVPPLLKIKRLEAEASLRSKEGNIVEASNLLEQAKKVCIDWRNNSVSDADTLDNRLQALNLDDAPVKAVATKPVKKAIAKPNTAQRSKPAPQAGTAARIANRPSPFDKSDASPRGLPYRIEKIEARLGWQMALCSLRLGQPTKDTSLDTALKFSALDQVLVRSVEQQALLRTALGQLESDVTLNVLAESTLALPATQGSPYEDGIESEKKAITAASKAKGRTGVRTKSTPQPCRAEKDVTALLSQAAECSIKEQPSSFEYSSTHQTHAEYSSVLQASILGSALRNTTQNPAFSPTLQALNVELPRIKALHFERHTVDLDLASTDEADPLAWPTQFQPSSTILLNPLRFEADYVDILPKSWTAVSLCLSEDCSNLYLARYQSGQAPLVLKLPFARHRSDGDDDDTFDFRKGREELQDIIELSNYTCHNSTGMDVKGAKTKWWNEREALDRRLHELLVNIEDIWFGGLKAVFHQNQCLQLDIVQRFRKSFDQILVKYLPSRRSGKAMSARFEIDDQILQLFLGLGESGSDIDEPLADLLYLVVDMLQFAGERNAYDEIDFDGMTIDMLNAVQACLESKEENPADGHHLVLVLDRRLQAFPWESMPCLQGCSVSRVGSMESLRRCVLSSRPKITPNGNSALVEKNHGYYILNPSSDLTATQKMLQPALEKMSEFQDSRWSAIVNRAPSEEDFKSALQTSQLLLYFGHGAGSQYIRPRTIKRLQQCSEVVWLMGCSSGAVQEHGELEPSSVPLAYLGAGADDDRDATRCKAVLATLWDVTDKDIDRFSLAVGEEWGLWPATEQQKLPAKTPRRREVIAEPCTPQQALRAPKTPKVRKTPAPAKTPVRDLSRSAKSGKGPCGLAEAVSRSREACYLRYLNGAAPVLYGIPVRLAD